MTDEEDYNVLHAIRDLSNNNREFYHAIRFLNNDTRNLIATAHERNYATTLAIIRNFMTTNQTIRYTMNIPLSSLGADSNFMEPVPVVPTPAQIAAAQQINVEAAAETICSICQEEVTSATRLTQCGHEFHAVCISQWFEVNPRCPVCRNDIREHRAARPPALQSLLRAVTGVENNDSSVHPD
jgi:hypothetical protein